MKPLYSVLFAISFLSSTILMGQTLTYGEVYDFEIGDVFQYKNSDIYGPQDPQGPPNYTQVEITSKWFSSNGDSVYYEKTWKTVYISTCENCPPAPTKYGVDTVYYTNLNVIISEGPAPIWDTNDCMVNWSSFTGAFIDTSRNYASSFCNKTTINVMRMDADSCQPAIPFEFDYDLSVYTRGLGLSFYQEDGCTGGLSDNNCYYDIKLVFFKKGQATCGTPVGLLNSVPTLNLESDLRIFPNPFNQEFTIKSDRFNITQVVIYDLLGNEILQKQSNGSSFQFNLLDMESGVYVISVTQENGNQSFHRIVKR